MEAIARIVKFSFDSLYWTTVCTCSTSSCARKILVANSCCNIVVVMINAALVVYPNPLSFDRYIVDSKLSVLWVNQRYVVLVHNDCY